MSVRIGAIAVLYLLSGIRVPPISAQQNSPPDAPLTDPAEIIRRVAAHEEENEKKKRDYTYEEKVLEKKLDGHGDVKSNETSCFDVMVIYGEHVQRQVSKDDKPLPPRDAAQEEEKINKLIAKHKNETEDQRAKRLEKAEKSRQEGRDFV